jgi:hypothetical protein
LSGSPERLCAHNSASTTTPSRARGLFLSVTLAALLAAALVAFFSLRLWRQPIWSDAGRSRFLIALAAALILTAVLHRARSLLLVLGLGAAAFLYTLAAVGAAATLGAAYWLGGVWCLGRRVLRLLRLRPAGGGVPALLLELPLGLALVSFGMGATAWLPIHRAWVHLLWPGLALALEARAVYAALRSLRTAVSRRTSLAGYLASVPVAFLVFVYWQAALMPEVSADGLAMHLNIAAWIAAHGSFHFDVSRAVWAVMPMAGDWLYASAYLAGGEAAARLVNLAFLLLLAGFVYSLARRCLESAGALLVVALFLSTPLAYLVTGSMFVENAWTLFLMAAVAAVERWIEAKEQRWLWVAGALAGSAVAGKFGALGCVLALAVGVSLALVGRKRMHAGLLAGAAVFVLFAAPPYLQALIRTGNPMFPYFNHVFRSPLLDASQPLRDTRFPAYLRPDLLYQITFHSHRFLDSLDGTSGFQLFVLWPVALLALRRRLPYWVTVAAVAAPLILLVVFAALAYLRYVYPVYVLAAVLAAWLLAEAGRYSRWLGRAAAGAAILCVLGNTWMLGAASGNNGDFALNLVFDPAARERFLSSAAPERVLIQYLNQTAPGQPAVFMNSNATAGLLGRAYTDTWHTPDFEQMLSRTRSTGELLGEFNRLGIRYLFANVAGDHLAIHHSTVRTLVAACGQIEREVAGLALVRLRDDCAPAFFDQRSTAVAQPGLYDDRSPSIEYAGDWYLDDGFREAAQGTLSYTNRPGLAFEFRFEGTRVTWVFTRAFNRGKARVFLDGTEVSVLDLYSRVTAWQQRRTFLAGGPGPHLLRVELLPEKNPASTDTTVDVDLLIVER